MDEPTWYEEEVKDNAMEEEEQVDGLRWYEEAVKDNEREEEPGEGGWVELV